jgi:hypothetical protein
MMSGMMPSVVAVSSSSDYTFSKLILPSIDLVAGFGVVGDVHSGPLIRHRYLVDQDPTQPNLRQVLLIQQELFESLVERDYEVGAGQLGENITTQGLDLHALPTGTRLRLGDSAVVELTGLRQPCPQVDDFQDGLTTVLWHRDAEGNMVQAAGVMSIVLDGGTVKPGDRIELDIPPEPHQPLVYLPDSHKPTRTPGIR